jgi:hypothetical protein
MGGLNDADWWWNVALDGVAGSVVGGLVTLAVLVLTLRHERRLMNRQALEAECVRAIERTRGIRDGVLNGDPRVLLDFFSWMTDLRVLSRRAERDHRNFVRLLRAASEEAATNTSGTAKAGGELQIKNIHRALTAMQNVEAILGHWIANPTYFEQMDESKVTAFESSIKDGWTIS